MDSLDNPVKDHGMDRDVDNAGWQCQVIGSRKGHVTFLCVTCLSFLTDVVLQKKWEMLGTNITPMLRLLHWLPLRQRVDFKVAALVHRSLSGNSASLILS